ncbi:MAG: GNAT family N-acetyltransferase [Spirochaetes bacterium]|nr:MAG: GNAT family N-acetyltransferase [Spirochaetota bacterium]
MHSSANGCVMNIRPITFDEGDIAGLTNLMNQWDALPAPLTAAGIGDSLRRLLALPGSALIACEDNGALIAYACLVEVVFLGMGTFIEVQSILVDRAQRRRGAARMLMERAESWARERGLAKISLSSRVHLEGAHRLYRSLGYTVDRQSYFFSKSL